MTKKKASRRRRTPRPTDIPWQAQNAVLAEADAVRARLRRRLERFDDVALDRLRALFTHLGRVVAIESPAGDATIEALSLVHDLFFPARAVLEPARRADRIAVALGPIRVACAELLRGGKTDEHARFARWQLSELVDHAFAKLDIAVMAEQFGRKPDAAKLLLKWNAGAGYPLGKLVGKDIEDIAPTASRARRRTVKASPRSRGSE